MPRTTIRSEDITAAQVKSADMADDAITADKILDDSITTVKILNDNVTLAKMADGTQGGTIYYGSSGAPTELAAGTSGQFLKTQGTSANPVWGTVASSGLNSVQTFTSSGTWTKPSGITKVIVEVQGSGGSGGGGGASKGAGAGAGGYAKKFLDVTNIDTATVTVGVGGLNPSTNSAGNAGGLSSFEKLAGSGSFTIITCGGGAGGAANYGAGGAGGAASGGDINIAGGSGGGGTNENNTGGGSFFTPMHYSVTGALNPSGPASGYGGGGEGSRVTGAGAGSKGGDGMNGIVYVQEYK